MGLRLFTNESIPPQFELKFCFLAENRPKKHKKLDIQIAPKNIIHLLDMSCLNHGLISAPRVENADVIRYSRKKSPYGSSVKRFVIATYECRDGYEFSQHETTSLYCSKKQWIGHPPLCVKNQNEAGKQIKQFCKPQNCMFCF